MERDNDFGCEIDKKKIVLSVNQHFGKKLVDSDNLIGYYTTYLFIKLRRKQSI